MPDPSLKDLFRISPAGGLRYGTPGPRQVFSLHWTNLPASTTVTGYTGSGDPNSETITIEPGENPWGDVLISVVVPDGIEESESYTVRFRFECGNLSDHVEVSAVRPPADRICFIGAGYHVDPVWWNTQRDYTDTGLHQKHDTGAFLELNRLYLDLLKTDPDFACTIETVDALQPSWFSEPELREAIRKYVGEGRLELIGSYDEPQSTLVGCELLCRNIAYGIGFAKMVSGITPNGLAQWDVFGHDPVWPALGKSAGLKWTTFCRGLYHGGHLPAGENLIPSEFRWISPDGSEHLTHYQSRHYTSGWEFPWTPPESAEIPVLTRFDQLAATASTKNVFLPCYGDFAKPFEGMMELVRWWNERYLSPKLVLGTQDDYLQSVLRKSDWLPPISRDLNPAFSGCNLSYADTKLAQRLSENVLRDAEILATLASLNGAKYPSAALDRAWRILCHTSHHDAVTGSESDQVYLDLTSLWREAYDLASGVQKIALNFFVGECKSEDSTETKSILVFNSLGWKRDGPVKIDPGILDGDGPWVGIDPDGNDFPVEKNTNGFELYCMDVPPLGFKSYRIEEAEIGHKLKPDSDPYTIENEFFRLTFNPSKGGGISSIIDKRSNREFLQPDSIANNIVVYPEYAGLEMGPWQIQTTGESFPSSIESADLSREIHPGCQTITSRMEFQGCIVERQVTLRENEPFIECNTSILGYADHDLMWRVEFPMNFPGTVPVAQTSGGVIGRSFGREFGDFLKGEYFGDWAIDTWGGLECPLSFVASTGRGEKYLTVSVGEIVIPDNPDSLIRDSVDRLVPLLAQAGITTVVTRSSARRADAVDWTKDGSRPDFRIAFGNEDNNSLIKKFASSRLDESSTGFDLPVIRMPEEPDLLNELLSGWEQAIRNRKPLRLAAILHNPERKRNGIFEAGCAVIVKGTPSLQVRDDGTISLGLFRSSSGCPSGGWIDIGPPTRMPDGSFFQHEHWSHRFEYLLMPHEGDWRDAGVAQAAAEFNHPLLATPSNSSDRISTELSLPFNETGNAFLQALRPLELEDASFTAPGKEPDLKHGLLFRMRELEGRESGLPDLKISRRDLSGNLHPDPDNLTIKPWSVNTFVIIPKEAPETRHSPYEHLLPTILWPARYWRSSLGPAGWASQPVFHKFTTSSIQIESGENQTIGLQITNNTTYEITGINIELKIPDFITVSSAEHDPVDLRPDETIHLPIQISCLKQSSGGGFISAELTDTNGFRTIAALPVNMQDLNSASAKVEIPEAVIILNKGVDLECSVYSELDQEIEGFIELILPFEAWPLLNPESVRQSIVLSRGKTTKIHFPLVPSDDVVPGRYYAVAKLHLLEEQAYSQACWVVVPDESGTMTTAASTKLPQGHRISVPKLHDVLTLNDPPDKWHELTQAEQLPLNFVDPDMNTTDETLALPVRIAFTDTDLYLMTDIPFRFKNNPYRKRNIRLGDCLQIAFFPSRIVEIGFALTSDGPYPWTWHVVLDSPYPPLASCSIDRTEKNTHIRTIIPFSLLRLEHPPSCLPWNFVIHRSDENHKWAGAWVLTGGTVGPKTRDGMEFGSLFLRDPSCP